MKALKNILQSNYFYIWLVIFTITFALIYFSIPRHSKYDINEKHFEGIITDIYIDGNYLSLEVDSKEKLIAIYYFDTYDELVNFSNTYKLGDKIALFGTLTTPKENNNFNTFNYRRYLYYERVYYLLEIDSYFKISDNQNIFYKLKNLIIERINLIHSSMPYLKTLILGDDRYLDDDTKEIYQLIGISHLLAISGMHIGLFTKILHVILKKIHLKEKLNNLIIIFFLLFYMFLVGFSPSVLRAVLFFIIIKINKLFKLNIKLINLYILTICSIVFFDPYILCKVGFQFSCIISLGLILFNRLINCRKHYISKLFMTSLISFLISIPICLYNFYQINVLSVIYNLFFVPFMSFILFPLSLVTMIVPAIDKIMYLMIQVFEYTSSICSLIPSVLIFKKVDLIIYLLYFLLIFLGLKNKKILFLLVLFMILHYYFNYIFVNDSLVVLDVGQGDSTFLSINNYSVLIDTGGKPEFYNEKWKIRNNKSSIIDNATLPLLKSLGVNKIEYLVLTHGDYDHMGEAINLVENFKVEKVIFNCGEFNELEKDLIKVLDKKKIPYYSCIKELNIDDNKLYFLNNKDYGNENDNSSVIYTELENHKFLFMGDAGVDVEEDLIQKYNLQDIDVLKVGHHGSKTSSSKEFVNEINPEHSIISVGKNNRYGHPNKEVLNNLENSKIYRTDQDGSIMFKLKNNKLKIETCTP